MAFKTVFYALQEVFPQIDLRILKAVASKYSSDVDTAVEFVLSDVLPAISESTETYHTLPNFNESENSSTNSGFHNRDGSLGHQKSTENSDLFLKPSTGNLYPIIDDDPYATYVPSKMKNPMGRAILLGESSGQSKSKSPRQQEPAFNASPPSNTTNPFYYDSNKDLIELDDSTVPQFQPMDSFPAMYSDIKGSSEAEVSPNLTDYTKLNEYENEEATRVKLESSEHLSEYSQAGADMNGQICIRITEETEPLLPNENCDGNANNTSDISTISDSDNNTITQQEKIAPIDALDEFISNMTESKEKLSGALESTINKMKEVEIHEESAKRAKEEASTAGQNILAIVEGLDQMIKTAKETNDEHAGEVYKEKSLLATQARELHSRLLDLSFEKDQFVSVIQEINLTLDARLTNALKEKMSAQKEIEEKEETANRVHKEKESIMEEIQRESLRLQKESQENTMLREFLLDSGRKVNILQAEISDIGKDMASLKERVNQFVSFEQTIPPESNTLVSPTCSEDHKNVSFYEAPTVLQNDYLTINEKESPKNQTPEKNIEDQKGSSDDEWEIY